MKFLVLLVMFVVFGFAQTIKDIEQKIEKNQDKIDKTIQETKTLSNTVENLAMSINKEEESYKQINDTLESTIATINTNQDELKKAKEQIVQLQQKAQELQKEKTKIENDVTDYVIEKFSMSMGIEQAKKESLKDIINKEIYSLVFESTKQEILDLNVDYIKINSQTRANMDKSEKLYEYIQKQEEIKDKYLKLQSKQLAVLDSLKVKHKLYQQELQKTIDKQNQIKDILGSLNILKQQEIEKEKERIAKAKEEQRQRELALKKKKEEEERLRKLQEEKAKQQTQQLANLNDDAKDENIKETKDIKIISRNNLDEDIDIKVKKIGSSSKGISIAKYTGVKTIAPLKSYDITKKFGTYYDEVYKMELFNESISMKTKLPNAKVFSIFRGQVVYAKENSGLLDNVVIVKHKDNLHTIYSHLDKISPTLKVGKWIPRGYVVGRVNDTLVFQATKNSQYIDPEKLFK
ncbi:MAG: peptidoglycan DD-metalloendopeptidase family protein [Campylobacterales bacterium]|nr:peptidoglycan DD-metalloendopeptidase family protein [Campylobacterales bacterium]